MPSLSRVLNDIVLNDSRYATLPVSPIKTQRHTYTHTLGCKWQRSESISPSNKRAREQGGRLYDSCSNCWCLSVQTCALDCLCVCVKERRLKKNQCLSDCVCLCSLLKKKKQCVWVCRRGRGLNTDMLQNDRWKKKKSGAGKAQQDSAWETGVCVHRCVCTSAWHSSLLKMFSHVKHVNCNSAVY